MARHEVERMKASLPRALMTAQAKRLSMASGAIQATGRRDGRVRARDVDRVNAHDVHTRRVGRLSKLNARIASVAARKLANCTLAE
jgi:hypothetical protein